LPGGTPIVQALVRHKAAQAALDLQGSVAIRTTVKPIGANEHDVDLVARVSNLDMAVSPFALKGSIGRRLRGNGNYAPLLEEMPRCWRLNYANEFHMDITPSIPNPLCRFDGELVPDKTLKEWKASNPKGYRVLFEKRRLAESLPGGWQIPAGLLRAVRSVRKAARLLASLSTATAPTWARWRR
jgi:Second Messenger Oligonucleotide or Dinucleotide Synthetase domain